MSFSKSLKKFIKSPLRVLTAVGTGGLSEAGRAITGGGKQEFWDSVDKVYGTGLGAFLGYRAGVGLFGGAGAGGTVGSVGNTITGTVAGGGAAAGGLGSGFMKGLGYLAPSMIGVAGNIYAARRMAKGQEAANEASVASAREQMLFQEYMSSTAHQREVEDLKKAGLNPVLSANAGAPGAAGQSAIIQNEAPDYHAAVASAMDGVRLRQEVYESNSRIAVNVAQAQLHVANAEEARGAARYKQAMAVMQELENEVYIQNGKLMVTEKGTKIITSLSAELRGWVMNLLGIKAMAKIGKSGYNILKKGDRGFDPMVK